LLYYLAEFQGVEEVFQTAARYALKLKDGKSKSAPRKLLNKTKGAIRNVCNIV
jgi:hypothetical protein